ncbi:hypothetical protein [Halorubrum sp. DTA46]|uniref:hypothetical protein n=1 Tax=Halorubrum sp. DTA46 TaxID=3402162 RepID=UPI003AACAD7A
MLDGRDYRHFGYLSQNELIYLTENKTDSRNPAKIERAIGTKAAALDEYLEYVAAEITLLEAEGYLDRELSWEQLETLRPNVDQYTLPNIYRETAPGFQYQLEFGYYFGYVARQLYRGTTPDQHDSVVVLGQESRVVLGFLLGLYERLASVWNPPNGNDNTPLSDEDLVFTTELQATFEEMAEHIDRIAAMADAFDDSLEANVYTKGHIISCIRQAEAAGLTPTVPLTTVLDESLSSISDRYRSQSSPIQSWLDEQLHRIQDQTEIRQYERFTEYITADIDQIKSRSIGNLEATMMLNTIGDAGMARSIDWIRQNLPGGEDQQKEQNIREIKNDFLAEKDGWERALIMEIDGAYKLSSYGELVWTVLNGDDDVADVLHADVLHRWDTISAAQSKYEPLIREAIAGVDIDRDDHIPVLDLDAHR